MTVLGFTVTFHSPFRVGAAYARDGVDAALDHEDPLPPDHLKGIMRAAATDLLGTDHPAVQAVFGSPRAPSPWAWSSAAPQSPWTACPATMSGAARSGRRMRAVPLGRHPGRLSDVTSGPRPRRHAPAAASHPRTPSWVLP